MNKMNTLGRLALSLLVSLICLTVSAQKLALTFNNVSLSDALKQIDQAQELKHVHFVFDELEDFRVTKTISSESAYDAVREVCGFYPMLISMKGKDIFVECAQKDDAKLIGRVVDENGRALEFANVALYSVPDSTFITGGVTNKNGDFVIPCGKKSAHVNFSYIGYETAEMKVEFPGGAKSLNVGTITLNEDKKIIREVLVEQTLASTSAEKSEYLPSKKQKNAATDATSLLQHMQIPQLRLNPLTGYVTTLSGDGVSIFIDYMPASQEDLAGLNTQDVKRVEILDYPSDARFQNKPHVINFVMQKYETGGYTKLTSTEMVLADFSANNSVYSKLSHKNWTLDATISSRVSNQKHIGSESVETFNLPEQTMTRTESYTNGTQRNIQTAASVRATYASKKMQLANRIEFLDDNTPKQELSGNVSYNPNLFNSTASDSRRTSHLFTPTYQGDWYFYLPSQWTLTISPKFQYVHNKQYRFYTEGEQTPIENDIVENGSQTDWQLYLGKTFNKKHTVKMGCSGMYYNSDIDYVGSTTATQNTNILSVDIPFFYTLRAKNMTYALQAFACFLRNEVNGETTTRWNPVVRTSISYAINPKNSLQAFYYHMYSLANGAHRNQNVMQENELMYYQGNPNLKNYAYNIAQIQYTWMPTNKFSASAYVRQIFLKDYFAKTWDLYKDGSAVIRRLENVGDVSETNIGASFTFRLLQGKMQLSASPEIDIFRVTGRYDIKENPLALDANASYYLGQFYFMAGYSTPRKNFNNDESATIHKRANYYFTAGWGNAAWKARLDIVNPFRTDWRGTKTIVETPFYSKTSQAFNSSSHQRINLTVSYTFNYGKKVRQGNELGTATGAQTSIL